MTIFGEWFARKLARRPCSIREAKTVEEKFVKAYGPRGAFAWVRLKGEPAQAFGFRSLAAWPEQSEKYDEAVVDGILDELLASGLGQVTTKVLFTLEEIRWHDVDSSRQAFYSAARGAVQKILGLDKYPGNVTLEQLYT